jgi:hypothetical protein
MTILQRIPSIPDSGQFVAIYTHDYQVWSMTLKRTSSGILQYCEHTDQFEDYGTSVQWLESRNPTYYIAA